MVKGIMFVFLFLIGLISVGYAQDYATLIYNTDHCKDNCYAILDICSNGKTLSTSDIFFKFRHKKGETPVNQVDGLKTFNVYVLKDVLKKRPHYEINCKYKEITYPNGTTVNKPYNCQTIKTYTYYTEKEYVPVLKNFKRIEAMSINNCQRIMITGSITKPVDWVLYLTLDDKVKSYEKWAWWNNSYQYKRLINGTNLMAGLPYLVNASSFNLGNGQEWLWSKWTGTTGEALYYNDYTDYVVANDTSQIPADVELGNGTSYGDLWGDVDIAHVWHLSNTSDTKGGADLSVDTGSPTLTDGKFAKSYEFTTSDKLKSSSIDMSSYTDGAIELWVYQTNSDIDGSSRSVWVYILPPTQNDRVVLREGESGRRIEAWMWDSSANICTKIEPTSGSWSANTWHHVVFTWNSTVAKLYVDGAEVGSDTSPCSSGWGTLTDAQNVNIGSYGTFTGKIDEVRLWTKYLTSSDIQTLYNNGLGTAGYGQLGTEETPNLIFVDIQSPKSITYNISTVDLNFTYDTHGLTKDTCKYVLDGNTYTLPSCQNTTLSNLLSKSHTIYVQINDTNGIDYNSSQITFNVAPLEIRAVDNITGSPLNFTADIDGTKYESSNYVLKLNITDVLPINTLMVYARGHEAKYYHNITEAENITASLKRLNITTNLLDEDTLNYLQGNATLIISNNSYSETHTLINTTTWQTNITGDYQFSVYYSDGYRFYFPTITMNTSLNNFSFYFPSTGYIYTIYVETPDGTPIPDVMLNISRYYSGEKTLIAQAKTQEGGFAEVLARPGIVYFIDVYHPSYGTKSFSYTFTTSYTLPIHIRFTSGAGNQTTSLPIPKISFGINFTPSVPFTKKNVVVTFISNENTTQLRLRHFEINVTNSSLVYEYNQYNPTNLTIVNVTNLTTYMEHRIEACIYQLGIPYCVNKTYYNSTFSNIGNWSALDFAKEGGLSQPTMLFIYMLITLILTAMTIPYLGSTFGFILLSIMIAVGIMFAIIPLFEGTFLIFIMIGLLVMVIKR